VTTGEGWELLDSVLGADPPPFALVHRPAAGPAGTVDLVVGDVRTPATLADVPSPRRWEPGTPAGHESVVVVPYRQLAERGFACVDDGTPLVALTVTSQAVLPLGELLERLPEPALSLRDERFDVDDAEYAGLVRAIVADEIGSGKGANFVLKRSFLATIADYTTTDALGIFRRLVRRESGSYWTFVVHTGDRTLVGATPERHVSLRGGVAVMNPISGTYRFPPGGPTLDGVLGFLRDRKETDELYMVLDEELKMMAAFCAGGGRVTGPYLREMARLAHTEYLIEGRTEHDPRDILRETLLAPTVTGSPVESACRVIRAYEPEGRGYYSGVVALLGHDEHGRPELDSAIVIRTADIDRDGRMSVGVGATVVRHSDPDAEAEETVAKLAALRSALTEDHPAGLRDHPRVRAALRRRNDHLARFWLPSRHSEEEPLDALAGRSVLVVDAEDAFTAMMAHQLRSLGASVRVRRFDEEHRFDDHDLVVLGPGPGDPTDRRAPKIAGLHADLRALLAEDRRFVAVCLSHQILAAECGFPVVRKDRPNQGLQREIALFGRAERVGFYNTFVALSDEDQVDCGALGKVNVSRDATTHEIHALRGRRFASLQFHPESVLTVDGPHILASLIGDLFCTY
jgi:phenazine biosynthesis protein phzE